MRIGDQTLCAVDPEWGELFAESCLGHGERAHGSGSSRTPMAASADDHRSHLWKNSV